MADVIVVGGGAAGFFGAIAAAEKGLRVIILEAGESVLAKVRISGGGRCNVTHHCFEPSELVKCYPRGNKALRGPLSRFQPQDTVESVLQRMTEGRFRHMPVVDTGTLLGVISIGDAVKARMDEIEHENRAMEEMIKGV